MSEPWFAALRADLALAEQIPLSELDEAPGMTLDMHIAFNRLTEALPRLLTALERSENDWTFLANLHAGVPLAPEVREALAEANLRLIRAVDGQRERV